MIYMRLAPTRPKKRPTWPILNGSLSSNSKTTLSNSNTASSLCHAMEAASIFSPPVATPISNTLSVNRTTKYCKSKVEFACCNRRRCCYNLMGNRGLAAPSAASNDVSSVADPVTAEVTWQIIVGAIAGVTPFVVAGIEFSKRIIAQRRCEVCGGSGLVLREKDYFKCPECGGFLPWQSWKRFFTG